MLNDQVMGTIYFKDENNSYMFNEEGLINLIQSMGYEDDDSREISKEIITISSPEDSVEMFRNKYSKQDLEIEDITMDMIKKSIEDEFEK